MSQIGAGGIILLPALAMGAVAGIAILAAAATVLVGGGVVVTQAGKGVVACGRYIDEAIQQHAAQQRAINQLCNQYEQQLQQAADTARSLSQTKGAKKRAELLSRIQTHNQIINEPEPQVPIPLQGDIAFQEETAPPISIQVQSDLDTQVEKLMEEISNVESVRDHLLEKQWAGLLKVDDLSDQLSLLRQAAEENQRASVNDDIKLTRDLRYELDTIKAELAYRAAEGRAKNKLRLEVINQLSGAALLLEEKAKLIQSNPGLQPAIDLAENMLDDADEFFQNGDLVGAKETSLITKNYLQKMTPRVEDHRHSNLAVAIKALEDYVEGFGFPPDDSTPSVLKRLIAKAKKYLDENKFDHCKNALVSAQEEADQLAVHVAQGLKKAQQDGAINLAIETLSDMGYSTEMMAPSKDGASVFKATRADGAYFFVWVTSDGLMQYKAENFGTDECQIETKEFLERLSQKNMVVNTQSEFNLTATRDRLMEILLRQGFDLVQDEPMHDGNGRVITATKSGKQLHLDVGHDSSSLEESTGEGQGDEIDSLERARVVQQQSQRQHIQNLTKYIHSRRIRE